MIKIVQGDILDATEDVICHQTNCLGIMGSGLAKQIKNKYPKVYEDYKLGCDKYSPQQLFGSCLLSKISDTKYIANLFGQLSYGRDKQYTDYEELCRAMGYLCSAMEDKSLKSIAIPYLLGCGTGGGSWEIVYDIIEKVLGEYNVVIYKLK